jgi:hypothetical protein
MERNMTTPPQTPYEQASYDLNKFRERRMSDRRATPRGTPDRRAKLDGQSSAQQEKGSPSDDLH